MAKKKTLAEKKEDLKSKQIKAKEKFKIEISVDDQDNISVNGPIGNFNLFMKIMSGAIDVVNNHNMEISNALMAEAEKKEKGDSLIIQ
ncbi:hypothetical protein LCGC14_1670100 [marine sediment metagenome]|uniref:Uncharacterized protein n=1 Tax=marine sediment metagenome TaxID=412755 RepID=A0A0F9HSI6_9ZZZZ